MKTAGGWNPDQVLYHLEALRAADQRALNIKAEGDAEARRIKEAGDSEALRLAREIQTYKDEKANELREQINSERGLYVTKTEAATRDEKFQSAMASMEARIDAKLVPIVEFVASQQGKSTGWNDARVWVAAAIGLVGFLYAIANGSL